MKSVCFYFQVHQPHRLKKYRIFDIGNHDKYFHDDLNEQIMLKVAKKCYLPANRLMLELVKKHQGRFKISYSITGTALEQFEQFAPEVLQSFKDLAATGHVEFLAETYYHSLSFLYSKEEFKHQAQKHTQAMQKYLGVTPTVFRNTELIFKNELAHEIEKMGFKAIIAEGADHVLGWRSPNYVYKAKTTDTLRLLLKNYKLSDDIAFRFSNKGWKEHPLTSRKFAAWVDAAPGDTINLFMDYETFGEHQWEDTGIFEFLRHLPDHLFERNIGFRTPSEVAADHAPVAELDIHHPVSWADVERDLSAWLGNNMQHAAINELYALEKPIKNSNDKSLIEKWRKLQTSDHFYYMCTKWFADGDVHKYFNPYDSPYDTYMSFMNVLNDIAIRLKGSNTISITEQPSLLIKKR